MRVRTALTVAGSDSGGGAGIQADLKTFLALGVHGMSAIVALTAQNTRGVSAIHEVPSEFVREQISQVAIDITVDAAKTGMLASSEIIEAVADSFEEHAIPNLVVDPVFISKSRDRLLAEDALDALVTRLFPLATLVTPNLYEAGVLLGRSKDGEVEITESAEMRDAATALRKMGPTAVLVKGGHLPGVEAIDIFYDGNEMLELRAARIDSTNTHGTGCTLSAAITAELAKGTPLVDAVARGKRFVTGAISQGLEVGSGFGPTNHGWDSTIKG